MTDATTGMARNLRVAIRPSVVISVAAVLTAALLGLALIFALGVSVPDAIAAFIDGTIGTPYAVAASVNRSIAFALVGIGFVIANRANLVNVGGEGQIAMGGIAATAVALYGHVDNLPAGLAFLVPLVAAAIAGTLWGSIAGILKIKAGTNEVISTLLLSFIAVWLLYWCVQSPELLRKPMTSSATLPESLEIPDATKLPLLTGDYSFPLHLGLPITVVIAIVAAIVLSKTLFGLQLRAVGFNPIAASRAGISYARMVMISLALAGALGGLAGGFMLLGEQYVLKDGFSSGYGFDGLVAGLLARGSVVGVIAAALLFGFLRSGGINMEMVAGVPTALVMVIQGLIVVDAGGCCFFHGAPRMTWELFAVFIGSSLRLAVPLLLAGTGELVSERAGVLNMSIEGMMLTGAFAAAVGAWATGSPLLGLLICIVAVFPVALLQAVLSNTLRANQIVTGIGINILVLGATTLAYREIFGARSREQIPGLSKWSPPLLGDIPAFGEALFQQVWLLYAGLAIIVLTALVLRYTSIGIVVHAAGAEPRAVDKSGVSVQAVRYGGVIFAGFMSALAGAFLSIGDIHTFTEGMTRGAGYLAIAAVIFGKWTIGGTVLACLLFGAATALQFQLPTLGIDVPNALLIMLPYLLALLAVGGLAGRQTAPRALGEPYLRR